jgi:hypothetical protein
VTDVHYDRHFGFIIDAESSERHFFHLSEVQQQPADTSATSTAAAGADAGAAANKQQQQQRHGSRSGDVRDAGAPLIARGQEVSYVLGIRQGKTVGLQVQLLPKGSVTSGISSSSSKQQQQQQGVSGRYVGVVANAGAAATGRDAAVQGTVVSLYTLSDSFGIVRGSATSADAAAVSDDVSGDVAPGATPAEANGSGKCSECYAHYRKSVVLCAVCS